MFSREGNFSLPIGQCQNTVHPHTEQHKLFPMSAGDKCMNLNLLHRTLKRSVAIILDMNFSFTHTQPQCVIYE